MNEFPWLTLLMLAPLLGGVVVMSLEPERRSLARALAGGVSVIVLMMAAAVWFGFDRSAAGYQLVERHAWVPVLGIEYHLGLDGLGLIMVLLTALIMPMALWVSMAGEDRVGMRLGLMLCVEAGLMGTFTALNFVHWFLFWELSLVPAFFLVRLWGGAERSRASIQFFIYTMVGSVALLLAFLGLFLATGTFDFGRLAEMARAGQLRPALSVRLGWYSLDEGELASALFWMAFLGFAVKAPVVPFHTWLPLTYSQAPTSVTMVLTGLMSKMGIYGMLRILAPVFPEEIRAWRDVLLLLCVASIVLPAFAALAQRDLRRLLAYSSINHLGYCLLGIVAAAAAAAPATGESPGSVRADQSAAYCGVLLQMFSHGITAAVLFCFVGFLEDRSGGLRGLDDFAGLRKPMPVFAGLMGIALFGSLGLPGLSGFAGEFLIFKGAFGLAGWAAVLSLPGLLVTAVFLLTLFEKIFWGPVAPKWCEMPDLAGWERAVVLPAIGLIFVLGIYPQALLELVNATVWNWVRPALF